MMPVRVTFVLVLFGVASTLAFPLSFDTDVEISPLVELPGDAGTLVLIRDKRQTFGNFPGTYPGGYPRGRPGGSGGRPGNFNQGFQPPSFSGANAIAGSQGFNAGNFGASSAGTGTQTISAGPGGISGAAGGSISQNYQFPNGVGINVSGAGSFGASPGGVAQGGSHSVSVTGPNGQPIRG